MMILTDGQRTVGITMRIWDEYSISYSYDLSRDFFDSAEEVDVEDWIHGDPVYRVEDVQYCIDNAEDWGDHRGEFADYYGTPDDTRLVEIEDIEL